MTDFLTQLPETLKNTGNGNYNASFDDRDIKQPVRDDSDPRENEKKYLRDKKREFEAMPPRDLAI